MQRRWRPFLEYGFVASCHAAFGASCARSKSMTVINLTIMGVLVVVEIVEIGVSRFGLCRERGLVAGRLNLNLKATQGVTRHKIVPAEPWFRHDTRLPWQQGGEQDIGF